jgi:hypothetical protein
MSLLNKNSIILAYKNGETNKNKGKTVLFSIGKYDKSTLFSHFSGASIKVVKYNFNIYKLYLKLYFKKEI